MVGVDYVTCRLVMWAKVYSGLRSLTFCSSICVFRCWNMSPTTKRMKQVKISIYIYIILYIYLYIICLVFEDASYKSATLSLSTWSVHCCVQSRSVKLGHFT